MWFVKFLGCSYCQRVSHKLIYEEHQCTSATVISRFYALHLPSFGNTHHDWWRPPQIEETDTFACKTFFRIEYLCIQNLVRNNHWTIDYILYCDSDSPLFFFVYAKWCQLIAGSEVSTLWLLHRCCLQVLHLWFDPKAYQNWCLNPLYG